MTVEGENDDISGIGQTQAAHGLCSGLPDELKQDYVQPHVGHYGVFNGAPVPRARSIRACASVIWERRAGAQPATSGERRSPSAIKAA